MKKKIKKIKRTMAAMKRRIGAKICQINENRLMMASKMTSMPLCWKMTAVIQRMYRNTAITMPSRGARNGLFTSHETKLTLTHGLGLKQPYAGSEGSSWHCDPQATKSHGSVEHVGNAY